MAASALAKEIDTLHQDLSKKLKFVPAVKQLVDLAKRVQTSEEQVQLLTTTKRVHTLLLTRYTTREPWAAALQLFLVVPGVLEKADDKATISSLITAAQDHLKDLEEPDTQPNPQQPQQQQPSQPSFEQLLLNLSNNTTPATPNEPGFQDIGNLLMSMAMAASVEQSGPPPASRDARYNLPVRPVTNDAADCTVCMDALYKTSRSKAKQMPCGHLFHEQVRLM
eukprot:c9750_g1_i1.p1 GENE.c9750_g1_i1~~c9750_g1_i1.p1  ORF type:complete len:241 (-),score=49.94 c9750_g1_i1:218-886(-)